MDLPFHPDSRGFQQPEIGYAPTPCPMRLPATGAEVLVLRDYASVVLALSDRRFSIDVDARYVTIGSVYRSPLDLPKLDPPATTAIRRPLAAAFSERNIEKHRAAAEAIAERLAARKPGDLLADYCEPFIAEVATATMGLPIGDWPHILELAGKGLGIVKSPDEAAERIAGWRDLYAYSRKVVDRKDDDGLMLAAIVAALDKAGLSDETVVHTAATVIVGLATPIGAMAIVAYELMRRPDVLRVCLENPWPAISEIMRYRANFGLALPRIALEDVRVNDELTIERGQVVVPSLLAAAHDPARTRRPGVVDLDRQAARGIVFGAGAHFCPGVALSRQWLEVGIATLFRRWPDLRVTAELDWQDGTLSVPAAIPVG